MKYYSCSETSICQWDLSVFQTSLNIFIKLKFSIQIETCLFFCLKYLSTYT